MCIGGTVVSAEDNSLANFSFFLYDFIIRVNQLFGISLIWGPNMAIRRDAFMQVGGIDTTLKTSDDWELILRLQKKFGINSTLYTKTLHVKTSPRKQKKLSSIIPYSFIGVVNYVSIFILRKSKTFGNLINIR